MIVRQGDVLIQRVAALPSGLTVRPRDAGRVVLAYGEVTGHAHAFAPDAPVCLYDAPATDDVLDLAYLQVDALSQLLHEEHGTIALPAGTYRVTRQREYTPERIVNVAD